jgi:class 3 adenylate cyclase
VAHAGERVLEQLEDPAPAVAILHTGGGDDWWAGRSQAAQRDVVAPVCRSADDGRMSPTAVQTVSVLMTDLVGSTAMADRLGPAAAEELRTEHFALLRGALERSGGREVKNLGDGLMVVFDSAAQSLACAVQMQQAVEARNRRSEEKLGVRIGVSLGDTTVEDGDYFGEPVVEAARL